MNSASSVASRVLFMALRWLRAGLEFNRVTIFGRRFLASRHDVALIRGALAGMTQLPTWGPSVTVEFSRHSPLATQQLQLCVDYEGTKIVLTPSSPFLITMLGFGGRALVIREFHGLGTGLDSVAPILEDGLDRGIADAWVARATDHVGDRKLPSRDGRCPAVRTMACPSQLLA